MPPTVTAKKAGVTAPPKALKKKGSATLDDDFEEWKKSRALAKPPDQLDLCDAELKDIVPRVLQIKNTQHPDSLVKYDFSSGAFIPIPVPGNYVLVFSQIGTYLHRESEDARRQMIAQGLEVGELEEVEESTLSVVEEAPEEEAKEGEEGKEEGKEEGEPEEGGAEVAKEGEVEEEAPRPTAGKKLPNQFNFCERAALTYNNPRRSQGVQTIPPVLFTFSAQVLQWIIYDGYQEDFEAQEAEKERERERLEKERMPATKHKITSKRAGKTMSEAMQMKLYECWKTLERMLNLNIYNYIALDYRYWEDPSDEFREEEGTLLPLWKFTYQKTRKHTVTDICWNPLYYDLFAVSFGFLDFTEPLSDGYVCLYTIKNPSFPDYICHMESAAMCLDIHKDYPYLILIGLYNGHIEIYNIQASCKQPAYTSMYDQKHDGIVWEVKWVHNMPDGELNFYSVSSDGKVNHWILMQSMLAVCPITTVYLDKPPVRGPDGTLIKARASLTCLVFHPTDPLIYMIGTDEGLIYKCNILYSAVYMVTYKAHGLSVHRIDFNRFNYDIFASCSADYRVKVWDDGRLIPLYVFDLGCSVGDVMWAPYSSTILGAVTVKGKAYIFDLNISQHKPICDQGVVSKKKFKLTRLTFNYNLPMIICGDDKGGVGVLKLSPNLRIPCKPPKKQQYLDQETLQKMKLDKLLSTAREPLSLAVPPDPIKSADD